MVLLVLLMILGNKFIIEKSQINHYTRWKVSKYGVCSGPYFPVFSPNTEKYGPKITPYLDTFHAAIVVIDTEHYESIVDKITLDF